MTNKQKRFKKYVRTCKLVCLLKVATLGDSILFKLPLWVLKPHITMVFITIATTSIIAIDSTTSIITIATTTNITTY